MDQNLIFRIRMNLEQVERFQHFLIEQSGLLFEGRRIQEMEKAVARRMIELGITSFDDYYRHLADPRGTHEELSQLVLSLTVGETQFFRTPDQFAALRKYVLPELLEREKTGRQLRLLSAGCATGEEPYSLLIILRELVPDFAAWKILIRACDINRDFLAAAREGVYSERKLKLVDPRTREKYFDRLGKNRWRVKEFLKDQIEWVHFNITADNYFPLAHGELYDVILCRNVLIYFNLEHIKAAVAKFRSLLQTGGYLFLGYSETLFKIDESFQSVHTPEAFFYQNTPAPFQPLRELPEKPFPLQREEILSALGSKPHPWLNKAEPGLTALLAGHQPSDRSAPAESAPPPPSAPDPAPETQAESGSPPPATEDQLWDQALEFFAAERFEEARTRFEAMIQVNPCSARAHLGLGFLYANLGVEDRSRKYAEEARRYDDLLPELYFLLALLDEKNGEHDRALENYQRVILLAPEFAMAHFNLGNLYLKLRRSRDARREFGNTVAILSRDRDNRSLRFSGGLSADAVVSFCELQRDEIARAIPSAAAGR